MRGRKGTTHVFFEKREGMECYSPGRMDAAGDPAGALEIELTVWRFHTP